MIPSRQLGDIVEQFGRNCEDHDIGEVFDMTSTSGYDNDGSTGPEMVENGVGLGAYAERYSFAKTGKEAQVDIFVCDDDSNTTYYQYGLDEDDAVRRLRHKLTEWQNQPEYSLPRWEDPEDEDEENED